MAKNPDCIVVGGGVAGSAAAYFLASRGIDVLLVEQYKEARNAARWINTVDSTVFTELELEPPPGVVHAQPSTYVLASADNESAIRLTEPPIVDVDMLELTRWLTHLAESCGVGVRRNERARIGAYRRGRREVQLSDETLLPLVVIDATGLSLASLGPHLIPEFEVSTAYQAVYALRSVPSARHWLARHGLNEGDSISFVGIEGGYSLITVFVDPARQTVSLLASAMHRMAYRSGRKICEDFARSMAWIGDRQFGAGGVIPLRCHSDNHVEDGLMQIGDAAGMTFPTHGSGVAVSMRAAELAANTAAACIQRGLSASADLWAFNLRYNHQLGAIHAAYQPTRYLSMGMTTTEFKALMDSGIVTDEAVRRMLCADILSFELPSAASLLSTAPTLLPIIPRFARTVELAFRLYRHYGNFPTSPERFSVWDEKSRQLYRTARKLALAGPDDGSIPGTGR